MTITEALISGIVQGITEFLPISSSGHLVLIHRFFKLTEPNIFFDICLHVGTLMAVILYFGKDILRLVREKRAEWLVYLAIGTVPAVIAALFFEDQISAFFMSSRRVACMLIVTAAILFIGQLCLWRKSRQEKGPTFFSSLIVGIGQAFALLPGISRSGATISTGLVCRMKAEEAFRFSFLLSIPAILGALLYKILKEDIGAIVLIDPGIYIAGTLTAFVTGLACLPLLWRVIRSRKLFIFSLYCLIVGISGIFLL